MSTNLETTQARSGARRAVHLDLGEFVKEYITKSIWLIIWLVLLTAFTIWFTFQQLLQSPIITSLVLVIWAISVAWTVYNEVTHLHSPITRWLNENLYNSITNIQISLILALMLLAFLRGFIDYAITRASFTTDPEQAAEILDQFEEPGANWGAVIDNLRNLMVFRFPREQDWRIYLSLGILLVLFVFSLIIYRGDKYRRSKIRTALTFAWLLSPVVIFLLLYGIESWRILAILAALIALVAGAMFASQKARTDNLLVRLLFIGLSFVAIFVLIYVIGVLIGDSEKIDPTQFWGGLLLTIVIAVFAIVASFPLGVLLALGRRSTIRGIPAWLIWGAAIILTILGLVFSTIPNWPESQTLVQKAITLWPVFIPLAAFLFIRYFNGNVVALTSTIYIEVWRGVPFITVLFMSIIIFPIFLPPNVEILGTWRVMVASALFSAAYLAENVRGGLQSIPNGQYEAADSLGLSTYSKYRLIILPQAIRVVIPAIVGQFIGLWKDTTLVAIVGLIDLLGAANLISAQPDWLGVRREAYIFVITIFFIGSAIMASYSRRLEKQLGVGER